MRARASDLRCAGVQREYARRSKFKPAECAFRFDITDMHSHEPQVWHCIAHIEKRSYVPVLILVHKIVVCLDHLVQRKMSVEFPDVT